MASAPLLQLSDIALTFGGAPLFEGLDALVQHGDRLALVGRNGSGKSTLLKVMAGLIEPDRGTRTVPSQVAVGYMDQDPDLSAFATLGDFAASGLPSEEAYRIDIEAEGLKLDLAVAVAQASGGERRRAALVKLLAEAPDLMLLDEPTNHLDIAAISWLEARLRTGRQAFVMISHDRAFLTALTRGTLWIDRGVVRRRDKGFLGFEEWRDRVWAEEDEARHKLNRKIEAEARWAVEGISARRKRNQGRVRALQALRAERAAMRARPDRAALELESGSSSGRLVIEAKDLTKSWGDSPVVRGLDLRILRGDRIALVGPNGAGKTTLLKLLTGEIAPDVGTVRHGTNLELAVFDQTRAALDPDRSLWDSLTVSDELAVSGRNDQVMVRGTPRHVVGYLKDFLFDEQQARGPVRALSGGEKARLLLARIMARQSNLLVLDEPTNDLDVETLDLLQDVLAAYDGTVLLVSHDRDFLDRVATTTLAFEGGGRVVAYAGGWSDYLSQRTEVAEPCAGPQTPRSAARRQVGEREITTSEERRGLSFTERHRFDALPDEIARLEAEISKLETLLSDPELFGREPETFRKASEALVSRQSRLEAAEEDWLLLSEKADATS